MYNATAYSLDAGGNVLSTCVVELDDEGRIIRSNAVQCTGLEGTPAYQDRFELTRSPDHASLYVVPGTEGYRNQIGPNAVECFDLETGAVLHRRKSRANFDPDTEAALDSLYDGEARELWEEG